MSPVQGPVGVHAACLTKVVTKLLLSREGLEQDLTVHKYITASLSTGGENESDRDLRMVGGLKVWFCGWSGEGGRLSTA